MTHKCNHACKHENVKFCDKCQKVHCLDCGKEWPENQTYWYTIPYQPQPSYEPFIPYNVTSGGTWTTNNQ